MNYICRDVGEPLTTKLNTTCDLCDVRDDEVNCNLQEINNLHDKLAEEHRYQRWLEEQLA